MHSTASGPFRDSEDLRNFGNGEPDDLLEDQRDAKVVWERRDRSLDAFARLYCDLELRDVVQIVGNRSDAWLAEREEFIERINAGWLTSPLAVHSLAGSCGDGVQPRLGAGAALETVPTPECFEKDLLDEVLGFGSVAAESEAERVQLAPVLIDQSLHRRGRGFSACAIVW
jgi:hypothetical protein